MREYASLINQTHTTYTWNVLVMVDRHFLKLYMQKKYFFLFDIIVKLLFNIMI